MKEHPILFSTPMVKAILAGKKTQTRRVMNPQPPEEYEKLLVGHYHPTKVNRNGEQYPGEEVFGAYTEDGECGWVCPYGQVGDHLWVRETWTEGYVKGNVWYKADTDNPPVISGGWKPSIFMPRKFSRITLEIKEIRVQRIQDISEQDAQAEGTPDAKASDMSAFRSYKFDFQVLWNTINAKRGFSWEKNPWVWAITFKQEAKC